MQQRLKRIFTDLAGYGLIILGFVLSPIPGPGGLPLMLAGLALLSIHNPWARELREYLLDNGGKLVRLLFPNRPHIQLLYDIAVVLLLGLVAALAWQYAAVWQITLAAFLFLLAVLIAGLNRDRAARFKQSFAKK